MLSFYWYIVLYWYIGILYNFGRYYGVFWLGCGLFYVLLFRGVLWLD